MSEYVKVLKIRNPRIHYQNFMKLFLRLFNLVVIAINICLLQLQDREFAVLKPRNSFVKFFIGEGPHTLLLHSLQIFSIGETPDSPFHV